eukprot:COSAG02_NODE_16601_length_1071_cov_1.731481_1_plen_101_part_10
MLRAAVLVALCSGTAAQTTRTVTASFNAGGASSEAAVTGTVIFTQVDQGETSVQVDLAGLLEEENDWHVHEWPVTGGSCATDSTGGHYNPAGAATMGELST